MHTRPRHARSAATALLAAAILAISAAAQDTSDNTTTRDAEPTEPRGLFDTLRGIVDDGAEIVGDALGISPDELISSLGKAKDDAAREVARRAYDTSPISLEEEWRYGDALAEAIRAQLPLSTDKAAIERVNRLAEPILGYLERTEGKPYTINVIDQDVLNAFAMLGGHIYIYQGLIDRMETDAAIQAVIAHEIAHVELEHCVIGSWPSITAQKRTGNALLGALASGAFRQLLVVGYSEQQEHECDEFAYRTQADMGIPKADRMRFLEVLERESARPSRDGQTKRTATESIAAELARHYQTHPPAPDRIAHLEAIELP